MPLRPGETVSNLVGTRNQISPKNIWPNNWFLGINIKKGAKCCNAHLGRNGILLPKLFWPSVTKNCSSDWEKLLKFEAEGQECLRSLERFIQTVKGQNNFCWQNGGFSDLIN